jgi:hypothetical protein
MSMEAESATVRPMREMISKTRAKKEKTKRRSVCSAQKDVQLDKLTHLDRDAAFLLKPRVFEKAAISAKHPLSETGVEKPSKKRHFLQAFVIIIK